MGKRKLSPQQQAQAAAKQAVLEKRSDELNEAEKMALYETRRKAITSILPDFNVPQDADFSEVENWAYDDLSTLPKWLGDIIEKIEGGKTGYLNSLDRVATDAAREAAEIAEHAAFIEAYSKVYRETFEKQFTLAVAEL